MGHGGKGHVRVYGLIQVEVSNCPMASKWSGSYIGHAILNGPIQGSMSGRYLTSHCQQVAWAGGKVHARVDGAIQCYVLQSTPMVIASKWLGRQAKDMSECMGSFRLRYRTAR